MASSRGRQVLKDRPPRSSFAFGSSTPRDLSYMNKLPCKLRAYNVKPQRAVSTGPSLREYMEAAKSRTPDEETLRTWAFGSSTPREFAHLMMIPPHLRQYDAKIVKPRLETRSFTNPNMRTSSVPTRSSNQPETTTRHSSEEDELDIASSEPDFVQDRRPDFLIKAKAKVTGGFESAQQLARQVEQPQTVPTAIHEDETAHVNEQVRQRKKGSWQVVDERDDSMLINEPSDDLDD